MLETEQHHDTKTKIRTDYQSGSLGTQIQDGISNQKWAQQQTRTRMIQSHDHTNKNQIDQRRKPTSRILFIQQKGVDGVIAQKPKGKQEEKKTRLRVQERRGKQRNAKGNITDGMHKNTHI
ncbi:hypothetical protein [Ethanoligenens harbinense]|nr:hypothetical protein [Ethanoligenens harbinense]